MTFKELFLERFRIIVKSMLYSAIFGLLLAPTAYFAVTYPIAFVAFTVGFMTGHRRVKSRIKSYGVKLFRSMKSDLWLHHNHC